jgi:hypothetical protein
MKSFVCDKCQYATNVKSNYTRHMNRKKDCGLSTTNEKSPVRVRYYAAVLLCSFIGVFVKKLNRNVV